MFQQIPVKKNGVHLFQPAHFSCILWFLPRHSCWLADKVKFGGHAGYILPLRITLPHRLRIISHTSTLIFSFVYSYGITLTQSNVICFQLKLPCIANMLDILMKPTAFLGVLRRNNIQNIRCMIKRDLQKGYLSESAYFILYFMEKKHKKFQISADYARNVEYIDLISKSPIKLLKFSNFEIQG